MVQQLRPLPLLREGDPLTILNALGGRPLPYYGTSSNVRDWLHMEDHVRALLLVATMGRLSESYNVGGGTERRNIDVVRAICALMDELVSNAPVGARKRFIIDVATG